MLTVKESSAGGIKLKAILAGTGVSIGLTLLLIAITAGSLHFTSFKESSLGVVTPLVLFLGTIGGGFFAGYKSKNKGLYHGLGVGVTTSLLALLIALLFFSGNLSWVGFGKNLLISSLGGVIGGIFGVGKN